MSDGRVEKLYKAIVWGTEPDSVGKRVTVIAESLQDARSKLEAEYGVSSVFDLHNEEDAKKIR